jgi:nodulation protein E
MRRVAITGVGVIAGPGRTAGEFWKQPAGGPLGHRTPGIGGLLRNPLPKWLGSARLFSRAVLRRPPRRFHGPFRAVRGDRGARSGGRRRIVWTPELRENTAIVTGSCVGGQSTEDLGFVEVYKLSHNRVHPLTIPKTMGNAGASHISMEFGITGPSFTISTACSSAAHAIGQAAWMIRSGMVDLALTGGSEAPFSFGILKAWEAMRVVSPDTCRPFSRDRHGMILGEGAGMLVLEPWEAAQARGARIHAELVGFGMSADACHITQPSAEGAARAMRGALRDAGIQPEQIGYINAHGTATAANDPTETAAIRSVFGAHANKLAISSTKSMHGHALGAAAALEAVATILSLRDGMLPPTANYRMPDAECDLDVIPIARAPRRWSTRCRIRLRSAG